MSDENRQGSGNFRANNGGQKRPAGGNRMSGNRTAWVYQRCNFPLLLHYPEKKVSAHFVVSDRDKKITVWKKVRKIFGFSG